MVNWFNQVDDTYRGQLRELNELNFARFDAKVEQRMSQLESSLEQRVTQVEANLAQRVTQVDAKLEQRLAEFEAKLERRLGGLESKLMRWMFIYWVGNVATTAVIVFGLAQFLRP